ncbi:MAG: HEAT repeat domain-containing protein [Elusimicrobia bacterium]|nr:HEAT repeat domain-containing protein [Elusimicrobiota bacterium]
MREERMICRHAATAFDGRFTLKGAENHYAPDRAFDTEHIRLDLRLDFRAKSLTGTCETTLRAIADGADQMAFDAVGFRLGKIRVDGRPAKFDYDKKKLTVRFPRAARAGQRAVVSIEYKVVRPPLGLHFIGPDRGYPDKPRQVWTQGEDEFARYWFPCHDAPHDRTTTEMIVRVPRGFTAISNGRLVRKAAAGRETLFHWKQEIPHATYLVTLAVGEFSEIKETWRGKPVLYYVPKGREDDARRAFGNTPKMMEFYSRKIGVPYAYPKYAQVAALDFIFGGMENTSATTQTALTLHDERAHLDFSSDPLVAHELAHQWFGDLLTCRDWSHAWLNESFATYFEALFTEFDKGPDEFAVELHNNGEIYFEEDRDHYRRPICTKVFKHPSDLFDRHLYEKGSRVLHMLRHVLGEDAFWKSMNIYVSDNRGRVVETRQLLDAIEKATGKNLSRFFDQWIYGAGHPEYKVRYWWDPRSKEAVVRVIQAQATNNETGLFALPVTFAFRTAKGEKRFTETVEKRSHLFRFKLDGEPSLALFDPDHWILKKVDFPKNESMWVQQLTVDPTILGRAEAARALGRLGGPVATAALAAALPKEKFWHAQSEIAQALGQIRTPAAVETLLRAHRGVEHPKARRGIIAALGEVKTLDVRAALMESVEAEKSYFAHTQTLRSLAKQGDPEVRPVLDRALRRDSWNDVIRSGALEALTALRPDDVVAVLKRHTAYGVPHTRRMAAIRCLGQVGVGREDVRKHLQELVDDDYLLVQLAAVRALTLIGDERCISALERLTQGHRDGRLIRTAEEAVAKLKKNVEDK